MIANPEYALYGDQMALVCPRCFTPLDARLGYDFVAKQHAHDWNQDVAVQEIWQMITSYEQFLPATMRLKTRRSRKHGLRMNIARLLDLLLQAEQPNDLRPIDVFDSPYFPSPAKLGLATRHLTQPLHICHLVERRRARAIVVSLLEGSYEAFGFGESLALLHRIRELMYRETFDWFERCVLDIARLALPI